MATAQERMNEATRALQRAQNEVANARAAVEREAREAAERARQLYADGGMSRNKRQFVVIGETNPT